jgi:hypothetical protein
MRSIHKSLEILTSWIDVEVEPGQNIPYSRIAFGCDELGLSNNRQTIKQYISVLKGRGLIKEIDHKAEIYQWRSNNGTN